MAEPCALCETCQDTLTRILRHSLLNIRRAAFAPAVGARYTEQVRSDIEREIRALEDFVREQLA